jgi:hypothetical protein
LFGIFERRPQALPDRLCICKCRREHGRAGACQRKKNWNGTPHENILAAADAAYG